MAMGQMKEEILVALPAENQDRSPQQDSTAPNETLEAQSANEDHRLPHLAPPGGALSQQEATSAPWVGHAPWRHHPPVSVEHDMDRHHGCHLCGGHYYGGDFACSGLWACLRSCGLGRRDVIWLRGRWMPRDMVVAAIARWIASATGEPAEGDPGP